MNAHADFYALWADGHGRKTSESDLYFCNKEGDVWRLPREMKDKVARPQAVRGRDSDLDADGVPNDEDCGVLGQNRHDRGLWP